MKKLAKELAVKGVDRLGKPPITVDAGIIARHQDMRRVAGAVVNSGGLGDNQAGTAPGACLLIGDQAVRSYIF